VQKERSARVGVGAAVGVLAVMLACGSDAPSSSTPGSDAGLLADTQGFADASIDADATASSCPLSPTPDTGGTKLLQIVGEPPDPDGIFDPSVLYPAGATAGFMAYSSVVGKRVHTRLAASNDAGATWSYFSDVNAATPGQITTTTMDVCGASTCNGTWVYETPSVVVDVDDPDKLFKVFVHRYFLNAADEIRYDIGGISMFSAKTPSGPWQESKIIGWDSRSPASSVGASQNASTDPALAGLATCLLLSEPGALVAPSSGAAAALHLALGCIVKPANDTIEIRLIRSTDHGQSWRYVSTLLNAADADTFGAVKRKPNGPSLYTKDGNVYLFVSPDGPVALGDAGVTIDGYRGCLGFAIDNLEAGTVRRCNGKPVLATSLPGPAKKFLGACAYAEGATKLGVVGDDLDPLGSPRFRIFATERAP
jgi:hypothetical protein